MRTKNIFISIFLTISLILGSCTDFLDIKPEGVLLKEDALNTQEDVRMLLNSTYTVLFSGSFLGGRTQIISELMTNNILGSELDGDWFVIYNRASSIFEGIIGGLYSEPYIAIYRANNVLENLDLVDKQIDRDRMEGEARFVRALAHFETLRLFAQPYGYTPDNSHLGIPIKIKSKPEGSIRETVGGTYLFIISELEDAVELLPEETDNEYDPHGAYPTKWAAKALLARVYFQMNDFENAFTYANDVIENSPYEFSSLTAEYEVEDDTVTLPIEFMDRYSKLGSNEAVFRSVTITVNQAGETIFVNRGGEFSGNMRSDLAVPYMKMTQNAYLTGTSDPIDLRAIAWYGKKEGFNISKKFNGNDQLSVPIITITELKLIRAESAAENKSEINIAIQDIQDIFDRAYGSGNRVAPTTANALIIEARNQRKLEFIFEGHLGQDLKRIGALVREEVIIRGAPWNCPGSVLQFPQSEIANNPGFIANPEGGC
ncbi:MAG: RagB/SusD family nutrient uptake outer membrane protein [Bacteroidales bacterium]|nr:RagB/SusD family nutrient uptake outer membrane protein [Bacteroidales bacterium]MDD4383782.1 RagB/SusD family nutrient uptake outer membrane protein [Bacteroidales bacterium]MDY0198345.1 RagB/SusD family nutrient uptake outer membrane protein [Tenuifilaceae bacterium]